MRRLWGTLLVGAVALLLAAGDPLNLLPYARQIDTVALLRTMGVDTAEEGVAVVLSSGGEHEEMPTLLQGEGKTVSGALQALQEQGTAGLFYGHVGQLLLGEELARRDARPALNYVLGDVEMRLGTGLYLIRDAGAGQALRSAAAPGTSAAQELEAMAADGALRADTDVRSVGEVLSALKEQGATYAPALRLGAEGLEPAGYGILRGGRLVHWAEGETAKGVNLCMGRVDTDVVELPAAVLRVVGARSTVRPVLKEGTLRGLEVRCRVEANVAELGSDLDPADPAQVKILEEQLAAVERRRVEAALELARQLNADYLGLVPRACLMAPWQKASILAGGAELSGLELWAEVSGHVERDYDAR